MEKIRKVSTVVRVLILILAVVHMAAFGYALFKGNTAAEHSTQTLGEVSAQQSLIYDTPWPDMEKSLVLAGQDPLLLLEGPQILFYLFIYASLFKLFGLYKQGILFSIESTLAFKHVGLCLLLWPLFNFLYPSALTLSLVGLGVDVERSLSFNFGTDELMKVLAGLMVWVIGWIMAQGLNMLKENELVI